MANIKACLSSKNEDWETPKELFYKYDNIYHFTIDIAASKDNALCEKFFTIEDNALIQDWGGYGNVCWMNPPYGRKVSAFMKKALEESRKGATVVCLVPSRTDTAWWHECAMMGEITFIKGRLRFSNAKDSAPFPSAIVVFKGKT